jgi:biopolymer transport protein ExbD
MRFGRHTRSERLLSVEITPMVDVVFLLIIFFMTAARFAQETRAQLDLPREAGEQQERGEEAGLVINIERDGTIIVGRRKLPLERLDQVVRGQMRRHGQDASQFRLTRGGEGGHGGSIRSLMRCGSGRDHPGDGSSASRST